MAQDSFFHLLILTLDRVIFDGNAKSLILPGEKGTFEVLPFHKRLLSRLVQGPLVVDGESYPIKQGVVKVGLNEVTVIIEEAR